jgi:hypothetical protein
LSSERRSNTEVCYVAEPTPAAAAPAATEAPAAGKKYFTEAPKVIAIIGTNNWTAPAEAAAPAAAEPEKKEEVPAPAAAPAAPAATS